MHYMIEFTEYGEVVSRHVGYTSYSEARRAVADMDMMIPFTWDYRIYEYTPTGILTENA